MARESITDGELAELVSRVAEATSAYIQGDIRRYLSLIEHSEDYTLLAPYGGEPRRGYDSSEAQQSTARFFRGGQANLEVVETYTSGDLVVLVAIERQHGEVGQLPEQDWSLRVTLVFRRTASGWQLAHRHADALTHPIGLEQLAALARGDSGATRWPE